MATLVEVDKDELLELLDHVNDAICFCAVSMPDTDRYHRAGNAMWAVVHRIAGDDAAADRCIQNLELHKQENIECKTI